MKLRISGCIVRVFLVIRFALTIALARAFVFALIFNDPCRRRVRFAQFPDERLDRRSSWRFGGHDLFTLQTQ